MSKPTLLPCPFCGSVKLTVEPSDPSVNASGCVSCDNCGASGPGEMYDVGEEWNQRTGHNDETWTLEEKKDG